MAFVIPLVEENYWVYVLAALLGPLQGFLNAMVVFYRDRKAFSKYFLRLFGIEYIKERWSTASSGFFKAKASTDSKLPEKRIARPISGNTDSNASSVEHKTSLNEGKHVDMKPEKGLCLPTVEEPISDLADTGAASQSDAGALQIPSQSSANIDTSLGLDAVFSDDYVEGHPQSSRNGENDAMLEFAVNAGLLTDDEYVLYHDSINRLEEISSRDM